MEDEDSWAITPNLMWQFEHFGAVLICVRAIEFSRNVFLGSSTSSELVMAMMGIGLQCRVPAQGFSQWFGLFHSVEMRDNGCSTPACLLSPTAVSNLSDQPTITREILQKANTVWLLLCSSYCLMSPSSAHLCCCTPDCGFQILEFISTPFIFGL